MKKIVFGTALAIVIAAASVHAAETNYVMKYENFSDTDWSNLYNMVGVDKTTGKVIPISGLGAGNYCFAYVPDGTEVSFEYRDEAIFNDINPEWGAPVGVDDLSRRGIFTGDENGNFNKDETLTCAQMAALLARMIGADGEAAGDMPFTDVPEDAWFAPSVYALYLRGIVVGNQKFEPDRPVTREELVTMEYRIIKALGGKINEGTDYIDAYEDFDSVSEYAKSAYMSMISSSYTVPYDYDYEEPYIDEYGNYYESVENKFMLDPQRSVTRGEAAMWLDTCLIDDFIRNNTPAIATEEAVAFGLDEEMPRITGSTSSYPITQSLYWALFVNGENHPMFPKSHDKTIESYKLLIDGETDVILVPDPSDEVITLAEEKGVELEYIPIADEGLVFFTAKDNPAENITSADIEKIYVNNSVANWSEIGGPDAVLTPFCRNNDSGSHAQMERFFLNGREINENIRREHISLTMSSILTEVSNYNANNPGSYALGYSMYYYFQIAGVTVGTYENLKLLSVDGVAPTEESLSDGSYPLATHYFAVIRADEPEDSPARKLAAFLTSDAGQSCISNAGFGARISKQ